MKYGIIAALDQELALVTAQMQDATQQELGGITYHQGSIHGKQVVCAVCSIGKVNAAICATLLLDHFAADCILNVGIAGAMDSRLKVLDVVFSSSVMFHDHDKVIKEYYPFQEVFEGDAALLRLAQQAAARLPGVSHHTGRIATGDVFVNDPQTKQNIINRCAPLAVEMEGAAVAHAAYCFGKPFLIIRTMSDAADDQADASYDHFIDDAAAQSAAILLAMLQEAEA